MQTGADAGGLCQRGGRHPEDYQGTEPFRIFRHPFRQERDERSHGLHSASRAIWGMGHRPGALFHQTVVRPVSQGDSGAVLERDGVLCEAGKGDELCPGSGRAERDSPDYEEQSVDRRMEDQVVVVKLFCNTCG